MVRRFILVCLVVGYVIVQNQWKVSSVKKAQIFKGKTFCEEVAVDSLVFPKLAFCVSSSQLEKIFLNSFVRQG